jgi:hypothetical protein
MAAALPLAALALASCAPRAAAAGASGERCPLADGLRAGLEDSVELLQVDKVVAVREAGAAPADGWYASAPGESCTDACDAQELECVPEAMLFHSSDMATATQVNDKIKELAVVDLTGEPDCKALEAFEFSRLDIAPFFVNSGYCKFANAGDAVLPDCSRVYSDDFPRRLCYCLRAGATPAPTVAVTGDPHVTNVEGQRFDITRAGVHELLRLPRRPGSAGQDTGGAALLEVSGTVESERFCAEPFVRRLDLSGLWLQRSGPLVLRAGGASEDSEDAIVLQVNGSRVGKDALARDARLQGLLQVTEPTARRGKGRPGAKVRRDRLLRVQMRFPGAALAVDWVHREVPGSSLNHLDFRVAELSRHMDVGGILGMDDHALAASPSPGCAHTQSLIGFRNSSLHVPASLLSAVYD